MKSIEELIDDIIELAEEGVLYTPDYFKDKYKMDEQLNQSKDNKAEILRRFEELEKVKNAQCAFKEKIMKKLLLIFCIFLLSCSGGGGSSAPETVAPAQQEVVVEPVVVPEPVIEKEIPANLKQDEWLALDIQYEPAKPDFVNKLRKGYNQKIVIMGTSLSIDREYGSWTTFLTDRLQNEFGALAVVVNMAKSSTDSTYGLSILNQVIEEKPDVVFIEFAINDAYEPFLISVQECYENLNTMVQSILALNPDCEIIIQTTNPVFGEGEKDRPLLWYYYQTYRYYAASRKLFFIDYYKEWIDFFEANPETESQYIIDGVHPALSGTNTIIIPALEQYIF